MQQTKRHQKACDNVKRVTYFRTGGSSEQQAACDVVIEPGPPAANEPAYVYCMYIFQQVQNRVTDTRLLAAGGSGLKTLFVHLQTIG